MASGYTFHYGVQDIFLLNVTDIVYSTCVTDGVVTIPVDDEQRAKNIFKIDPVPCVQKNIYVTDSNGNQTIYDQYTECVITLH
jgi:hypothetical protein